ncbi:metalloregulator ArsR/SmtB family transcription factor [Euzebya tangerina]|uniref:metalloregulator ArsR/SmtB family transcription factor n=1 Tax=Euzebya tangerina TaxID=591198 RepID=UPI000E3184DC|nr:metalloregulator ArsR/SmtB family transcription factor [Euzebya tangerina]
MAEAALDLAFAALADPTRRKIVEILADGDETIGELAEPFDMSVQAISKHVKVLERSGLVTRGATRTSPAHLDAEVFTLMTKWIDRYQRRVEARYQRLDAVLADLDDRSIADERDQS